MGQAFKDAGSHDKRPWHTLALGAGEEQASHPGNWAQWEELDRLTQPSRRYSLSPPSWPGPFLWAPTIPELPSLKTHHYEL